MGTTKSSGTFSAAANSGGFQLRLATSSADLPATGAVVGYFSGNRTGVSADSLYLNASLVGSPNSTTTGVGSGNAQLLKSNGSFAPATVTIAISHFGSAMSSTDETNACRAFGAYLVSLGAIGVLLVNEEIPSHFFHCAADLTQYGNMNTNMHSSTNGWNF